MRPILNITHNDLDGAGAAIMVQRAFGDDMVTSWQVGYSELDEATKKAITALQYGQVNRIIFTDISPKKEALEWIDARPELAERVTIFDHHANSDWATYSQKTAIHGDYRPDACGTLLSGARLCAFSAAGPVERLCLLIDVYDRWQLNHSDRKSSEILNAYFRFVGFWRFVDTIRGRLSAGYSFAWTNGLPLTREELYFLAIQEERDQEYVKDLVSKAKIATDQEGRRFAWVIADRLVNEVGDELAKMVDYAAVVSPEWGTISLRSVKGGVNVGEIARARGGGGHDHASGYHYEMPAPWDEKK